jgi:putative transposase
VVWAGDFTYFWFIDRFWYLATVIDVHTREIVGWHVANHHTTALIMDAFQDAVRRTKTSPKYFHSDQGSEYVSGAYESLLRSHGTVPSQSSKGKPWQNGFQESFYSNFKLELGEVKWFDNVGQLIEAIHCQIVYYNNKRIHTSLKMSPVAFRIRFENKTTATVAV